MNRVPYEVDPWRMSLLWETSKRFSPYAKYFVRQWVKNVTKGGELPKDEKTWSEEEQNDSE